MTKVSSLSPEEQIDALRVEMDKILADKAETVLAFQGEMKEVRDTVEMLRAELEQAESRRKNDLSQAASDANHEMEQLKATIVALRDELENSAARYKQEIADARSEARDEQRLLQETIATMRQQLEQRGQ